MFSIVALLSLRSYEQCGRVLRVGIFMSSYFLIGLCCELASLEPWLFIFSESSDMSNICGFFRTQRKLAVSCLCTYFLIFEIFCFSCKRNRREKGEMEFFVCVCVGGRGQVVDIFFFFHFFSNLLSILLSLPHLNSKSLEFHLLLFTCFSLPYNISFVIPCPLLVKSIV